MNDDDDDDGGGCEAAKFGVMRMLSFWSVRRPRKISKIACPVLLCERYGTIMTFRDMPYL